MALVGGDVLWAAEDLEGRVSLNTVLLAELRLLCAVDLDELDVLLLQGCGGLFVFWGEGLAVAAPWRVEPGRLERTHELVQVSSLDNGGVVGLCDQAVVVARRDLEHLGALGVEARIGLEGESGDGSRDGDSNNRSCTQAMSNSDWRRFRGGCCGV